MFEYKRPAALSNQLQFESEFYSSSFTVHITLCFAVHHASKMKILRSSVSFWQFCGVYLPASSTTKDKYLSLLSIAALCGALQSFLSCTVIYIVTEYDNVDLSQLFYAFLQVCANAVVFGPYLSALFVRKYIGETIESLQEVVGKSKYSK